MSLYDTETDSDEFIDIDPDLEFGNDFSMDTESANDCSMATKSAEDEWHEKAAAFHNNTHNKVAETKQTPSSHPYRPEQDVRNEQIHPHHTHPSFAHIPDQEVPLFPNYQNPEFFASIDSEGARDPTVIKHQDLYTFNRNIDGNIKEDVCKPTVDPIFSSGKRKVFDRNIRGETSLYRAVEDHEPLGNIKKLTLVRNQITVCLAEELTPLMLAMMTHQVDIYMYLASLKNAPVNVKNIIGHTPLWFAVYNHNTYLTEALLRNGANPFIKDDLSRTPLDIIDIYPSQETEAKQHIRSLLFHVQGSVGLLYTTYNMFMNAPIEEIEDTQIAEWVKYVMKKYDSDPASIDMFQHIGAPHTWPGS